MSVVSVGDPAGASAGKEISDELSCIQELQKLGLDTQMGFTQNFVTRRESVAGFLRKMVDGKPGLILSPTCCVLRDGFKGEYYFRKYKVQSGVGGSYYSAEPDKTSLACHIHDALQYGAMYFDKGTRMDHESNAFGVGGFSSGYGSRKNVKYRPAASV